MLTAAKRAGLWPATPVLETPSDAQAELVSAVSSFISTLEKRPIDVSNVPIVGAVVGRDLPRRVYNQILRKRALPLLASVVRAQAELRGERAQQAAVRAAALLDEIRRLDAETIGDTDTFFRKVEAFTHELDGIIDDATYATFDQVGLLHQLRALNVLLRTSKALWHAIRVGNTLREDPDLRADVLETSARAERLLVRGHHGQEIGSDLERLESDVAELDRRLSKSIGEDSGLGAATRSVHAAQRVWVHRQRLEKAVLEREGREGPLTTAELFTWVRHNGVPPEVSKAIFDEEILPVLIAIRDARGEHVPGLRDRADVLIEEIRAFDPGAKSIDEVEAFAEHVGRGLDEILREAESIAKPMDGPIRALRESRAALSAFRMLFIALRASEASRDPAFTARAKHLLGEVDRIASGRMNMAEADAELAKLQADLERFGHEIEARLHIHDPPGVGRALETIRGIRKAIRLGDAARRAMNPDVRRAAEAFGDLEMEPERRRRIYDRALGEPMVESVVGLLLATREIELEFTFKEVGRGIASMLRAGGNGGLNPLLARSPLAFLGDADFESAFAHLDEFILHVDSPKGRASVDAALNVVRAIAAVEREALGEVAARIPEGEHLKVTAAILEWLVRSFYVLIGWIGEQLDEPTGIATADFLELMAEAGEAHLDELMALDPKRLGRGDVRGFERQLAESAKANVKDVGARAAPEAALILATKKPGGVRAEKLRSLNEELVEKLRSVETTEASLAAMKHIAEDMGSTLKMIANLVHLFGAASNDRMDPAERSKAIGGSVERMGPLFVKLMQTLVNMQSLLAKVSPDFDRAPDDPLITSLERLQDECTPVPWPAVESEIRRSLGLADDAPLTGPGAPFVSIDPNPLKSGSIGQTHRATAIVGGRLRDAVVKVLRPGVDETFETTIRVTRIAVLVFAELLRLDRNGAIFGSVKPEAERILGMLDRAIEGFIESFRVETNFPAEAANMKRFERTLGPERHVLVPEVFDDLTRGNVLTMEEVKGHKLSHWIERYRFAETAPALAEVSGPLRAETFHRDAVGRAELWLEQTHGARASSIDVLAANGRFVRVRMGFLDEAGKPRSEVVEVRAGGAIESKGSVELRRSGAERKAAIFAEKAFGRRVVSAKGERVEERCGGGLFSRDGYLVQVELESSRGETATVFVDAETGAVEPRTTVPDLTKHGLEALRDRLSTTFAVQLARGLLHGDPHQGNFFILADGKSIGLIDFGLAVELGLFDGAGPMMLLSGAFARSPTRMAEAMIRMSALDRTLSDADRETLTEKLATDYDRICRSVRADKARKIAELPSGWLAHARAKAILRFEEALDISRKVLQHQLEVAGLPPAPKYLQALKATFSMGGNIAALEREDIAAPTWKDRLRLFKDVCLHWATAPFLTKRAIERKNGRLRSLSAPIPIATTARSTADRRWIPSSA